MLENKIQVLIPDCHTADANSTLNTDRCSYWTLLPDTGQVLIQQMEVFNVIYHQKAEFKEMKLILVFILHTECSLSVQFATLKVNSSRC